MDFIKSYNNINVIPFNIENFILPIILFIFICIILIICILSYSFINIKKIICFVSFVFQFLMNNILHTFITNDSFKKGIKNIYIYIINTMILSFQLLISLSFTLLVGILLFFLIQQKYNDMMDKIDKTYEYIVQVKNDLTQMDKEGVMQAFPYPTTQPQITNNIGGNKNVNELIMVSDNEESDDSVSVSSEDDDSDSVSSEDTLTNQDDIEQNEINGNNMVLQLNELHDSDNLYNHLRTEDVNENEDDEGYDGSDEQSKTIIVNGISAQEVSSVESDSEDDNQSYSNIDFTNEKVLKKFKVGELKEIIRENDILSVIPGHFKKQDLIDSIIEYYTSDVEADNDENNTETYEDTQTTDDNQVSIQEITEVIKELDENVEEQLNEEENDIDEHVDLNDEDLDKIMKSSEETEAMDVSDILDKINNL